MTNASNTGQKGNADLKVLGGRLLPEIVKGSKVGSTVLT